MVSMEQQEQHSSVGVEELTKVRMRWSCQALAKQRLVPLKLRGTSRTPMIVHVRFMASSYGLTPKLTCRGRCKSLLLRETVMRPRSGAAPGSAAAKTTGDVEASQTISPRNHRMKFSPTRLNTSVGVSLVNAAPSPPTPNELRNDKDSIPPWAFEPGQCSLRPLARTPNPEASPMWRFVSAYPDVPHPLQLAGAQTIATAPD